MRGWLNSQSIPPMLPPYHAGSAKSDLMTMLEAGHGNVKLSKEELDNIACWSHPAAGTVVGSAMREFLASC